MRNYIGNSRQRKDETREEFERRVERELAIFEEELEQQRRSYYKENRFITAKELIRRNG